MTAQCRRSLPFPLFHTKAHRFSNCTLLHPHVRQVIFALRLHDMQHPPAPELLDVTMASAETFGETKGRKARWNSLCTLSRLATAGTDRQRQRQQRRFLRPTHLAYRRRHFSAHHMRASLRVLTCWDFRTPRVTAHLRRGYPRTALFRECAAHITHSVRVASACYFRTCMRHLSDGLRRAISAVS